VGTACYRNFGSHLLAQGSSWAVQDSSKGAACHCSSSSHLPTQDSSGAGMCPVGSNTRLPVQDSSEGTMCHRGSGLDENR
jgi:hypothetical protein